MFEIIVIFITIVQIKAEYESVDLNFPDYFLIGAATSAYQTEGAWNISDKSESNFDYWLHNHPDKVVDQSTGDVATDSYYKYKEDINILKNLKMNHYRFSMSWSRILPKGHAAYVSLDALRHYHKVLDALESSGIIPVVTIYHWDHPQSLEEMGGWLNDDMIYYYVDYAKIIFQEFAHRVKIFVTINEPQIYCRMAYSLQLFPPGLPLGGRGDYLCLHNMLKANALAYKIYDQEFRRAHYGIIGIASCCSYTYDKNRSENVLSDRAFEFNCGWLLNPIFSKSGDYPRIMKQMIAGRSYAQGYNISRLPIFSKAWVDYIRGTSDFIGLNHYKALLAQDLPKSDILNWPNDAGLNYTYDPKWLPTQMPDMKVVPEAFGDLLRTIKKKYNNPSVFITESGTTDGNGINDALREKYLYSYLKEVLIAMHRDKCKIFGYTIWSFLDSFEWYSGYSVQFGLISVNFTDPNRPRTLKKSTSWLKSVLETRQLQPVKQT